MDDQRRRTNGGQQRQCTALMVLVGSILKTMNTGGDRIIKLTQSLYTLQLCRDNR